MAQWAKATAARSDSLDLISGTHMLEGENSGKKSMTSACTPWHAHTLTIKI